MTGRGIGLLSSLLSFTACEPSRKAPDPTGSASQPYAAERADVSHCKKLTDRVCNEFGKGSEECRMAGKRIRSFSANRCLAMLSHYDEVSKAASRYVEGRRALISSEQMTGHGPAPSIGLPGVPITMVFFGDFDSPACARGAPIATAVKNLHQDEVRLVFRQFPLSGNEGSHLAAEASLAANEQGKFWPFYDVMFANELTHDRAALERYAKAAGLDREAFDKALETREFAADVDADRDLGKAVNVSDLPALFVNGNRVRFPYGEPELAAVIANAKKP